MFLPTVVALALLAGCEDGASDPSVSGPTPRKSASPTDDPCLGAPDFRPTFVPSGWHRRLLPGDGGGPATDPPGLVGHYGAKGLAGTRAGARRGYINVIAGSAFLAQTNKARIKVLGSIGTLGDIHEGFSVEVSYQGCDYAFVAYGVERSRLAQFARGLDPIN